MNSTLQQIEEREHNLHLKVEPDPLRRKNTFLREFKQLIADQLDNIKGSVLIEHKGVQASDYENINKIKDLELENKVLKNKIEQINIEQVSFSLITYSYAEG